jgi:hypothetical protein
VQVRIVRPIKRLIEGIDTSSLKLGEVYDLTSLIANLLIAEGVAMLEMGRADRRQSSSPGTRTIAEHRHRVRRRS